MKGLDGCVEEKKLRSMDEWEGEGVGKGREEDFYKGSGDRIEDFARCRR